MIDALLDALGLKALPRTGWVRSGVPAPESVAAHSWGVAWLTLVLLPADLCRERALCYALLHDLPEVHTGDLTPHDGVAAATKHAQEHAAMAAICAALPGGDDLLATWQAYEAQADPEARFVRQLDRLDMALQAVAYQRSTTGDLTEFLDSAAVVIEDAGLRGLLDQLRRRMNE